MNMEELIHKIGLAPAKHAGELIELCDLWDNDEDDLMWRLKEGGDLCPDKTVVILNWNTKYYLAWVLEGEDREYADELAEALEKALGNLDWSWVDIL